MKKIRAAVVGYGNIGHYTIEALEASPDFEIAGVVRRQGSQDKPQALANYEVVDDISNKTSINKDKNTYKKQVYNQQTIK